MPRSNFSGEIKTIPTTGIQVEFELVMGSWPLRLKIKAVAVHPAVGLAVVHCLAATVSAAVAPEWGH